MASQQQSSGSVDEQLSAIDGLSVRPFPEEQDKPRLDRQWSGPGFHLAVLRESQDFWESQDAEIVEAAELELEADLAVLTVILTERWGAPDEVDLWPYLRLDEPAADVETPEPLSFLCNVAGDLKLWRLPNSGRWIGLAIGQADPEWPFQLLAAVGEMSSLAG